MSEEKTTIEMEWWGDEAEAISDMNKFDVYIMIDKSTDEWSAEITGTKGELFRYLGIMFEMDADMIEEEYPVLT